MQIHVVNKSLNSSPFIIKNKTKIFFLVPVVLFSA